MKLTMTAHAAHFWDAGPNRMVSVYMIRPALARESVIVKTLAEAEAAFAVFVAAVKAQGEPFSARAIQTHGSRAVPGWKAAPRLAVDWEPTS